MNNSLQKKYSQGFTSILAIFTGVYTLGAAFMLFAWSGLQGYDPHTWRRDALPFYVLVCLSGALSSLGIWKWKKWGVYGLAGTWILSGIINSVFAPPAPVPYKQFFLGILLVIAFFLLLLPDWQKME